MRAISGHYAEFRSLDIGCFLAWNGSWNVAHETPRTASAVSAMIRAIGAASALGAWGRTSCKRLVSGSIPLTGSQVRRVEAPACTTSVERFAVYQTRP